MNDTEGLRRLVEATERVAKALERMAEQQAEFLATMPAEEEPTFVVPEGMVAEPIAEVPQHAYEADCACPACWSHRRRLKRTDAP